MEKHDFVTIADFTREKILYMIEMAQEFERHPNREILKGKVVATLFFEPSTRTRLSFETAANRLGARVIGFADPKVTSGTKGETLKDTISMVANYADVIVMRHYIEEQHNMPLRLPKFLLSTQETELTSTPPSVCLTSILSTKLKEHLRI